MTGRATNAVLLHGAAPRGRDQSRCPRGAPGLARAAPPQLDGTAFLCVRLWCYLLDYASHLKMRELFSPSPELPPNSELERGTDGLGTLRLDAGPAVWRAGTQAVAPPPPPGATRG